MGADIHCYVICKKKAYSQSILENGATCWTVSGYEWKLANVWEKNVDFRSGSDDPWDNTEYFPASCFHDRNYQLFGVLAGVRSSEYPQMDIVRGLPGGCPQELRDYIENQWGDSCHDVTWYSLGELNKAVKNKKKWPKYDTWYDENGVAHKDKESYGPHYGLKRLRDSVLHFADMEGWFDDPEDIRVVIFFDS